MFHQDLQVKLEVARRPSLPPRRLLYSPKLDYTDFHGLDSPSIVEVPPHSGPFGFLSEQSLQACEPSCMVTAQTFTSMLRYKLKLHGQPSNMYASGAACLTCDRAAYEKNLLSYQYATLRLQ